MPGLFSFAIVGTIIICGEYLMSKTRKIIKRKRKTGYITLTKPSPFKYVFASFEQFAAFVNRK